MPSKRSRISLLSGVTLATAATLGFGSAATAADVLTYPAEVFPGLTVESDFPNYVLTFDCDEWQTIVAQTIEGESRDYGDLQLVWVPDGTAEVRFTCDLPQVNPPSSLDSTLFDEGLVGGITPVDVTGGIAEAYDIAPNTFVEFFLGDDKPVRVAYSATVPLADPTGDLLFTENLSIPAGGGATGDFGDGEDFLCQVAGERVFATLDVAVTEAGNFTFRIVGVDPMQSGEFVGEQVFEFFDERWQIYPPNPWGDYVPINDPLVILYEDFDPANLDQNQIACNDDSPSFSPDGNYLARDSADRFLSRDYSEISLDLDPGNYSVVVTTWDRVRSTTPPLVESSGSAEAASTLSQAGYQLDDLPEQSATVELWGSGELQLGHVADEAELADTGSAPSQTTGLFTGAVLLLIAGVVVLGAVARARVVTPGHPTS